MNQRGIVKMATGLAWGVVTVGVALFVINSVPALRRLTKQG